MRLNDVNQGIHKRGRKRRLGRGKGSGKGKLCGRGQDGQKSRAGYSRHPASVGEDLPMIRRIPKRGFNNRFALKVIALNVGDLSAKFSSGEEVTPETLCEKGVVKRRFDVIKILGDGELDKPLNVSAHRFSESAKQKITAAGGSVVEVQVKRTPQQRVAELAEKS